MDRTTPPLEQLRAILDESLCHRCGACSGICPAGVIAPDGDGFPSWEARREHCTQCGLCVRVCPGREFSFPAQYRAVLGGEPPPWRGQGKVLAAYVGYATDPDIRARSTSGGVGTGLPLHLLRTGRVRGAFSVRADADCAWKPAAFVARTEAELRAAMNSRYPACSLNHLFRDLREDPGPFVLTGLPCHVHGWRKMAEVNRRIGEKVALSIGLFCHSCLDHQALRDILGFYRLRDEDVAQVVYRAGKLPGYVRVQLRDGRWLDLPYAHLGPNRYRPNAKECLTLFFKFYSPLRCRMCIDGTAEFADLSIGDPWIKGWESVARFREGYSLILVRTERGRRALEEARDAGALVLEPFPLDQVAVTHEPMLRNKRMRGYRTIAVRRRRGHAVPEYDLNPPFDARMRRRAARHVATYFAADRPALRGRLVRFILSRPGRFLVGVVFFRRRVVQAAVEVLKAKLRGPG